MRESTGIASILEGSNAKAVFAGFACAGNRSSGRDRVTLSLTRTLLWLYSLGIFEKGYAQATAGSSDEHADVAPDLFTAETPLGTYQGMTDQVVMSRTAGSFRTVLAARGSSNPSGWRVESAYRKGAADPMNDTEHERGDR